MSVQQAIVRMFRYIRTRGNYYDYRAYRVELPGGEVSREYDTLSEIYENYPEWDWDSPDPMDHPQDVVLVGTPVPTSE